MLTLLDIPKLKKGDKIAAVSLSWGGAGEFLWRYNIGKKRLQDEFGLQIIEMENTLKGEDYLSNHPEKRAEDLMNAFKDKSIRGIISCIGGDESVRMLPYIDYDVIAQNPKPFIGFSDSTVTNFICLKAGIKSFYGPAILNDFAENVNNFDYTKRWFSKALFENSPIGEITPSEVWTSEFIPWEEENQNTPRLCKNNYLGYELLQGKGKVRGRLLGGCLEVLEMLKGTEIWPTKEQWEKSILFFETSEEMPVPGHIERWLRNYGSQGILNSVNGIIFGKPYNDKYYEEYKAAIKRVFQSELNLDFPIIYNMNFGHTAPMFTIPYGAEAEIDCDSIRFSILD